MNYVLQTLRHQLREVALCERSEIKMTRSRVTCFRRVAMKAGRRFSVTQTLDRLNVVTSSLDYFLEL